MLLDGRVTLPAERYGEFFRPWLSGEHDGRIFLEFQVGFAALLAAAGRVLGSMGLGLAVVAAWNVVAVYGFARALWRDHRAALWSACLVAASPMLILHSGLFLTYVATLAALASAGWAALVAVERSSAAHMALAGLALSAALLIRPLDALVVTPLIGVLVVHRARTVGTEWMRIVTWAAVAAMATVPALLVTAWYNTRTTGSPTQFPNMAADPLNRFGFGIRRLVESEPVVEYHLSHALGALRRNLWAIPSWTLGGPLLLLLATWGLTRPGASVERAVVLAVGLAFPVVYFFWWATRLSAAGATNGIGPHYYVPTFLAVGLLAARGAVDLVGRTRIPALAMVAVLVLVTVWALPDKLKMQRDTRDFHRAAAAAVPDGLDHAVVVVPSWRPYLQSRFPFMVTDPALDGDVLYAIDRGSGNADLATMFPDRSVYRLAEDDSKPVRERFWLVCELPATC
jgi:4-amino-4-deoxy-L-arabinose transferase-like glycosyltransferase